MGIRDRKFFAISGFLGVMLILGGCSSSEPQIIDESKYEDLYKNEREPDDEVDSDDVDNSDNDADSDDESEGLDDEDFPDPPELPEAVKEESEDGAIAAVEYFFEAYTYAFQTSDTEAFSEIVTDDCESCQDTISAFQERKARNEYARTDGYSSPEFISLEEEEEYHVAHVEVDFSGDTVVYEDGSEELLLEETTYSALLALEFIEDHWVITKTNAVDVDE